MSPGFVSQSKLQNELELILATHTCYFIPRTSLFLPFIPHHNVNKYLIIGLYIKKVLSTKNQAVVKKKFIDDFNMPQNEQQSAELVDLTL